MQTVIKQPHSFDVVIEVQTKREGSRKRNHQRFWGKGEVMKDVSET